MAEKKKNQVPRTKDVVASSGRYGPGKAVTTRVAPRIMTGALSFEAEQTRQMDILTHVLLPTPHRVSNLAFEAELREVPTSGEEIGKLKSDEPSSQADVMLELKNLAAGRGILTPDTEPKKEMGAIMPLPDIEDVQEHENKKRSKALGVFTSEKVSGKKHVRQSSTFLSRGNIVLVRLEYIVKKITSKLKRTYATLDKKGRHIKLPLANLIWSIILAVLVVTFGGGLEGGAATFAASVIFSMSGQPVRNLLGLAGVLFAAAAFGEIFRQRVRFIEVFFRFFS